MAMQLDSVVPFGRSFDEYINMFLLTATDLHRSILSVADGPASFNAEGTERGYKIQSLDPLYAFSADEIKDRFYAVRDGIIQQIRDTPKDWVWHYHASPDALQAQRTQVTERFAADYQKGQQQGRYTTGALPDLPYADNAFDLGLCSHFLFLYSQQLDVDFHIEAIAAMLRVCKEVRVFPLLTLGREKSPHIEPVTKYLEARGFTCAVVPVMYELQKGGNKMLKIIT
ncbi:MAG: SAM-dependent methyltransferase [Cyanobacteria bacterium P01_D01_bin.105]